MFQVTLVKILPVQNAKRSYSSEQAIWSEKVISKGENAFIAESPSRGFGLKRRGFSWKENSLLPVRSVAGRQIISYLTCSKGRSSPAFFVKGSSPFMGTCGKMFKGRLKN
jgi:hypothetical protein